MVAYTNYDRPTSGTITAGSGDMPRTGNRDAMARDAMIRYSDNEATNLLWAGYGGTEIIDNVKERYRLSDATMASPDWGATLSSPADLVAYFDRMLDREGDLSEVETEYLRQLLYSLPRYSYGDADQNIGLRAALPKERVANKSGWVRPQIRTTAGFMGDNDRYAIAVLGSYISAEELTGAIKDVFPRGKPPATTMPRRMHLLRWHRPRLTRRIPLPLSARSSPLWWPLPWATRCVASATNPQPRCRLPKYSA